MENRCLISTYHFVDIKCANEVYINFLITLGPQNVVEESVLRRQPMLVSKKELDSYTPCKAMALKLSFWSASGTFTCAQGTKYVSPTGNPANATTA